MVIEPRDLDDLVRISSYAGGDIRLAQGGGGNTSVKSADGSFLWIKASGFRLAEVTRSGGWLGVSLEQLNSQRRDPTLEALPPREAHEVSTKRVQEAASDARLRPSLETSFHAWLPDRLVLHTHSIWANCFSCMVGGRNLLEESFPVEWIAYQTPGYLLGKAIAASDASSKSRMHSYLLENHGWITTGERPEEAITRHEAIRPRAELIFGPLPDHTQESPPEEEITAWAADWARLAAKAGYAITACPAARDILRTAEEDCPARGALVPDDVVYGIHAVERVAGGVSAANWFNRGEINTRMRIVWLEGQGFVLIGPSKKAIHTMEENLLANVLLHRMIPRVGRVQPLPADEIDYLGSMDSEKYRRDVAAGKLG